MAGGWLLRQLGPGFTLLTINAEAPAMLFAHGQTLPRLALEATPEVTARYLGDAASTVYLIRPDSHVAARWTAYDAGAVTAALDRAMGKD